MPWNHIIDWCKKHYIRKQATEISTSCSSSEWFTRCQRDFLKKKGITDLIKYFTHVLYGEKDLRAMYKIDNKKSTICRRFFQKGYKGSQEVHSM